MSLKWLFNKPKDFDCRDCAYCKPFDLNPKPEFDECTHPKNTYKFCSIERNEKGELFTVWMKVCGTKARRFRFGPKKFSIDQLTLREPIVY